MSVPGRYSHHSTRPPTTEEENLIDDFRGPAYFLSNFYRHPVLIGDDVYPTAEHAFQALKAADPAERAWVIASETPLIAKRRGRTVRVVEYWGDIRVLVMEQVLEAKFGEPPLADQLIATHPHTLVEGNTWHDQSGATVTAGASSACRRERTSSAWR